MKQDTKKIFLRTFGCQMNMRDSEVICGLLKKEGYEITGDTNKADVIMYNTCSVRKHAEDKVWSELGKYKTRSHVYPQTRKPIIGLVGCMTQNYKDEVFKRAPQIDFAIGPSDIDKIPSIIERVTRNSLFESKFLETDGSLRPNQIYETGHYQDTEHAYVVISEGCSNHCSYCIVPFVRGKLINRNYKDIINEIKQAVREGIDKFTLLGQNVNAYKDGQINFAKLLKLSSSIKGIKQISFVTSHPKDTTNDLFKAMADNDNIKKYLHLPVQSGSDRILKLMNRGYSRQKYLDLIGSYRRIVDNGALSTDIIVGFPGETDKDFNDTYNLVKEVGFNSAYIFKYSPRPHTKANDFKDDVPRVEKERRHRLILDLQKYISKEKRSND